MLYYVDLEKAFDTVLRDRMMMVLAEHYELNKNIVEAMWWMYTNVLGQAVGHHKTFGMTIGVKQRCPLSPTLFRLYFDRVSEYVC